MNSSHAEDQPAGVTLVVVGLGNIGSQVAPLIAAHPLVRRVVLVDSDRYEISNLGGQRIRPQHVGQSKAVVQARYLRALRPSLEVTPLVDDVAHVPMGRLRGELVLGCVDSVAARIKINQIACRLGIAWLDAGVEPRGHLVRVEGYLPGLENPCFECGLGDADYRLLGSRQPCQGAVQSTEPTHAPASLGALAAALLAEECGKVLGKNHGSALLSRQIIMSTEAHTQLLNVLRRNPQCRFDHATWSVRRIPGLGIGLTLGKTLERLRAVAGGDLSMAVAGTPFALCVRCLGCGSKHAGLHVVGRLAPGRLVCRRCQRGMAVSGLDLMPRVHLGLPEKLLSLPLSRVGFKVGDVLEVTGVEGRGFRCEVQETAVTRCEEPHPRKPISHDYQRPPRRVRCELSRETEPSR